MSYYKIDPYLACNFSVEIDNHIVAGFTDVSGLSIETQVDQKSFGGENDKTYAFIVQTKYSDITLKHGIADRGFLWDWYMQVVSGKIIRKQGSIYLRDESGARGNVGWDFLNAFPIKWEGPTFSASGSSVAFESIVLTHQGLSYKK